MSEPTAPEGLEPGCVLGVFVPGLPHPLLCPEQNAGWGRLRKAFDTARERITAAKPDLILVYSTMWISIIGHQVQADPKPTWVHVDELFHDLGSIPYEFVMDSAFAEDLAKTATERGLMARTVSYRGFPIDTGSIVALKLLNPDNAVPAVIVSSNMYSDRAETRVLGKACREAIERGKRRVVVVVVGTLSNRLFTDWIRPEDDRVHSQKDDEWNRKLLEFLGQGRLEDTAQLSREIQRQIRIPKVVNFKSFWFWSAVMGSHNEYRGEVLAYEALYGTGGAVVVLEPAPGGVGLKEFDEDDVDVWQGDRNVVA
jgi:2-aminophenol/2-amino-5-chlorophenol 1,6-dioxygenase alpha subunit